MIVAAHGREFRDRADEQGVPVIVIVREPETQLHQWPLAAIGPVVVRTKVAPPDELTPEWFVAASEALGEEAIDSVENDLEAEARINRYMDRLGALRDHDELHQALAEACRDALHESAAA
jgi:S-adenosylmethionine/arginine decarboxylase-like enzyme